MITRKVYRWAIAYRWKVRGERVTIGLYASK